MTGVAPGDETAATPTGPPPGLSQVAGEGTEAIAAGLPPGSVQIAYAHTSRVSHSWHTSMMRLIGYDKMLGGNLINSMPFAVSCSGPHGLVEGRNLAVTYFLDKTDAEWLFFVDTDMGFDPDAVERLVFAADPVERPVVGGLCFAMKHVGSDNKGGFHIRPVPTLFMWGNVPKEGFGFVSRFRYPPDCLTQVAGTGAAFLLIHRTVLTKLREEIGDKWFELIQYENGTRVSEDLSFCYRVGQAGFPIFVHTGVSASHHKEIWLDEKDYVMPEKEPLQRFQDAAVAEESE